jgi:plasmid stabilization system protein ParE
MTERRSSLDLEAAMAALEGRARPAQANGEGDALSKAARLPRRTPRAKPNVRPVEDGVVARIRSSRTGRVHMFSTRASAETLNALYALARDERRTVTELFEESVWLLVRNRQGKPET